MRPRTRQPLVNKQMKDTSHMIFDKSGTVTVDVRKLLADPDVQKQIQDVAKIRDHYEQTPRALLTRVCDWLPTDCRERQQLRNDIIKYLKGETNGTIK